MAGPRLHLPFRAQGAGGVRGLRRRVAVRRARRAGRRSEGVPVRRGAQGRAQTLGVQGVRHRLHPGDAERHLHGVAGRRLRRVLQLRPDDAQARARGHRAEPAMTARRTDQAGPAEPAGRTGQDWIADALREHEDAERHEQPARRTGHDHGGPATDREQQVLDRIDRARRRRPRVREERITMSHGAGGKATRTLIEAIFLEAFRNPELERLEDSAELRLAGPGDGAGARLALTTDSYVVSPLFFPGGDIGDLAVNGTVNDLSVAGAEPLYLSAGFIIEEGFLVADLM